MNTQRGPEAALDELQAVVDSVAYKPGWEIWLAYRTRPTEHYAGSEGMTLHIRTQVPDSTRPGESTYIEHWMAPPPTSWTRRSWERWVLDQLILVETHEAMEFYSVGGHKCYFPSHGPGHDPYAIEYKAPK